MPFIFSYGTLQHEGVQLSTFGRRLNGQRDVLHGHEQSVVKIADPQMASRLGKTHHANVKFNGKRDSHVSGMVFEIAEVELGGVDKYEETFSYARVAVMLASGREAWVYVYAGSAPSGL